MAQAKSGDTTEVRKVELDLLVVKRLKRLATNLCEPAINKYQVCLVREGFFRSHMRLACTGEKNVMNKCILAVSNDKEIVEDCKKIYVAERSRHNEALDEWVGDDRVNELVDAYRRDQHIVVLDQEKLVQDIPGS